MPYRLIRGYASATFREESDLDIEAVALRAGFGSAPSLREHFRRATATTPTAYRRSFQPAAA
jgi:transcriptional regulator GlxA family with amidase domain